MNLQNIIQFSELENLRKSLPNKKIILGTGCFDILHVGHLYFLKETKAQAEVLVVGINSDRAIRQIKGDDRPIIKEAERCEMIASLRYVDYVFVFDDAVADQSILSLCPDLFAIGEQSVEAYPSETKAAKKVGAQIYVVKRIPSVSTTSIINSLSKLF